MILSKPSSIISTGKLTSDTRQIYLSHPILICNADLVIIGKNSTATTYDLPKAGTKLTLSGFSHDCEPDISKLFGISWEHSFIDTVTPIGTATALVLNNGDAGFYIWIFPKDLASSFDSETVEDILSNKDSLISAAWADLTDHTYSDTTRCREAVIRKCRSFLFQKSGIKPLCSAMTVDESGFVFDRYLRRLFSDLRLSKMQYSIDIDHPLSSLHCINDSEYYITACLALISLLASRDMGQITISLIRTEERLIMAASLDQSSCALDGDDTPGSPKDMSLPDGFGLSDLSALVDNFPWELIVDTSESSITKVSLSTWVHTIPEALLSDILSMLPETRYALAYERFAEFLESEN